MISRFSSRTARLSHVFLKDRLQGAASYDRIAGYFRSSIFDLIHEEIASIGKVRIVCNADLAREDIQVAGLSKAAIAQAQLEAFTETVGAAESLLSRSRWRRLHEILTAGNVEIRVVSRENAPFLHGKAGLITRPDGSTSAFIGSINETFTAWHLNYEIVWEDPSPEAADWVRQEFDWLWKQGVPLADAVIDEIGRQARKVEIRLAEMKRKDPVDLMKAALVESPSRLRGESLMPWQKAFVKIWSDHREQHGAARLILADEVGVGKTLSMAATGALSVLLGDGPLLILCPATLVEQWQVELWDKLGLPSARWTRNPAKGWVDHTGHLQRARGPEDMLACPCQIGIVSTGVVMTRKNDRMLPEAEALLSGRFGMVVLDEGHRARVKRGMTEKEEPGNLWEFMKTIAGRTRHLVIGTATPIQTHREEIWDLMKLLAVGQEHVLGRSSVSRWHVAESALAIVSGELAPRNATEAWPWLRSPLPAAEEHPVFRDIRHDLRLEPGRCFTDAALSDLDGFTRDDLEELIAKGDMGMSLGFLRYHNPLGRHVVLRRRRTLEEAGLMAPVGLRLWPREDQNGGLFAQKTVLTPHYYDLAYEAVDRFTRTLSERTRAGSFMKSLLLQRICSSITSGITSVDRMIAARREAIEETVGEDEALQDFLAGLVETDMLDLLDREIAGLRDVMDRLREVEGDDPKGRAVLHFLVDQGWAEHGCIIFSQYYDTARWIGELVSTRLPGEPVALYAGVGRSGILLDGEWRSVEREEIKALVRRRELRLLTATDAAGEGLNLQTLGTLINVDLPWNPSRLEQRIGRIKRFGQRRSTVDMASLVYQGTKDAEIHARLSERMRDRHEILGSIPDVIEDDWIESEQAAQERLRTFTTPPSPADIFSLRHGDFLETVDQDWETFERVIARHEILDVMKKPWSK